jgi:hypothetical protein
VYADAMIDRERLLRNPKAAAHRALGEESPSASAWPHSAKSVVPWA